MKYIGWIVVMCVLSVLPVHAQVGVPNNFVPDARILASEVNANFSALSSGALNRTGGTITGNIVVDSGVTIDGIDIGAVLGGTGTPTFATITTTGNMSIGGIGHIVGDFDINTNKFNVVAASGNTTVAGTLDVTGALTQTGTATFNGTTDVNSTFTIGSGNVQPFDAAGKIQAISSTYFANLSGTNLTGVALLATNNTFSARNDLLTYTETKTTANISAGAVTYNLALGSQFETSLNANITSVTISNTPASGVTAFTVKYTADGTLRTITWPAAVVWPGGVAPTMTSTLNKRDIITFVTYDGGTTWFGFVAGQNY